MPDWVYTDIEVRGSRADIDMFMKKYGLSEGYDDNNGFTFDKIIPEPKVESDCPKDCLMKGNDGVEILKDKPWFNWYKWHNEYWGTKWDACDTNIQRDENTGYLMISFSTAWDYPRPILRELKQQNKYVRFFIDTYGEEDF